MKTIVILCFTFLIVSQIFSQHKRFGKVDREEILLTEGSNDLIYSAKILYQSISVDFEYRKEVGFVRATTIRKKIKLFNENGLKWSQEFFKAKTLEGDSERLTDFKGFVYFIEGVKIKREKIDKKTIINDEFSFANLKNMTDAYLENPIIVEYQYKVYSPFVKSISVPYQFQIPIDQLFIKIAIPDYFKYNVAYNSAGDYEPKMVKTEELVRNPFQYKQTVYSAMLSNIPAITVLHDSNDKSTSEILMTLESTQF